MAWLSKSVENLIENLQSKTDPTRTVESVIVGSGYGAAVAALRFAEHGQQVYVLERGNEYLAGDFPNDVSQIGGHLRSEIASESGVTQLGYESGLFDFKLGLRAGALVGNGLGGGSLINAGVGLRPDDRVFKKPEWPAALRNANQQELDGWFDCAKKMHELQTPGDPAIGTTQPIDVTRTEKFMRMQDMRATDHLWKHRSKGDKHIDIEFEPAQLSIQLDSPAPQNLGPRQPCIGCGDCVSGCNHNAKLSLDATYLARAFKAGAQMFTGVSVLHIEKDLAGNPEFPWIVHFVRTSERKQIHEIQQHSKAGSGGIDGWVYQLRAKRVVLGAGAFGSTEILLRSRAKGLVLSNTALGMAVSGNGDDISCGFDLKNPANAVGAGSKSAAPPVVGPTISSMIRFKDPKNVERGTVLQDGAIPGLLEAVAHEILTTNATLAQMGKWRFRSYGGKDPLTLKPKALRHTMAVMGMGHDSAGGVVIYDAKSDRVKWGWPKAADETTPDLHKSRVKGCVEELGGIFLQNPAVNVLPDAMKNVLSGPKLGGMIFTVHPLGGCRMGDNSVTGVVNHWGAVWSADDELHDGLYVLDGSIIPSALGANPMLTITALAERSCSLILKTVEKKSRKSSELPTYPPIAKPKPAAESQPESPSSRMAEVLRGSMDVRAESYPPTASEIFAQGNSLDLALFLEFDIPSWHALYDDANHVVKVTPKSTANAKSYTRSRLVVNDAATNQSLELDVVGGFANFCRQTEHTWPYLPRRVSRYLRTGLTYLIGRWLPDSNKGTGSSLTLKFFIDAFRLIGHASQKREFYYEIQLADQTNHYLLTGTKTIEAAASCKVLLQWIWRGLTTYDWPALERLSVWQQFTQIQAKLSVLNSHNSIGNFVELGSARLAMDLPDMLRRVKPQLGPQGDNITGLLDFAGYPLWLARTILQTRLLDFRAPDYKTGLFDTDPALTSKPPGYFELDSVVYPDLRNPKGELLAKAKVQPPLLVPLTRPSAKGVEPELVRIGLVRYKAKPVAMQKVDGITRAKSIILINGFLLSTQSFVAEELNPLGGNLATQLYAAGWDVWMLEYRASPLLDVSARDSNMDDIAAFDIPYAVDHVLKVVSSELGTKLKRTQIFAYSRCVGSGALAMSLLRGFLRHSKRLNKLAGIQLSDFHPFLVGSVSAQLRLQVAALLSGVLKLKYVQFTAGNAKSDLLHSVMDRIFSSVNYDYKDKKTNHYLHEIKNERCPHEDDLRKHQPDSTTCKRITGLMSRSYLHSQLLPATHEKLDFYFGRGNIGVFLQGTKCVTQERLVNADGQNGYVTDENIQKYMNMPLLLVHGKHNALFDIESFERSKGQFKRLLPNRQTRTVNRYLRFKNFGHVDLILGKDAPKVVIPKIVKFFDASLAAQTTAAPIKNNRCHARMARTGPIVGWVRPDKDKDGFDVTVIRVLIEIEDRYADQAIAALTVTKYANEIIAQVWPVQRQLFQALGVDSPANNANPFNLSHTIEPQVSYSVADISVPTEFIDKVSIEMVSIHTYAGPPVAGATSETLGFPPGWGVPMDRQDLDDPKSKLPFSLIKQGKALFLERSNGKPLVTLLPAVVAKLSGIPAKSAVAQSPVYDEKSLLDNRNTRLVPAYTLSPTANIASLLNPLIDDLELSNDLTFRADPKTLSRQRRTLRDYTQRVLELERKQLEDTKTGNLTFFAAGCRHPGLTGFENVRADASLRRAHDDINASQPRFMLMLGDQIYADVRGGVVDTESPIEKLLPRYRGAFGSSSSFRKIAKRLPMYMVMDDHEINDNWSQEQVLQSKLNAVLQHNALAAFTIFQFEHGPSFPDDLKNPPERVEGFNYCYEYNDIPFLVLDTRTQRTRVPDRRILHSSQWRWLEEWLRKQQQAKGACPKFIASGSVVAPGLRESTGYPSPRTADSWQMCADDRKRLLSFIATEEIENVVFLSSDYHCSAAAEITFTHSPVRAWGIVAPPLHAPMPFANVQASGVSESERIAIARGAATVKSTAWDGEGWLTCAVSRVKKNSFRLDLTFNLRKLSESDWHMDTHPVKTWRL